MYNTYINSPNRGRSVHVFSSIRNNVIKWSSGVDVDGEKQMGYSTACEENS